jgi:hypothetical protein
MFKFKLITSNLILLPTAGLKCYAPELTPYLIKFETVMAACFNGRLLVCEYNQNELMFLSDVITIP